MDFQAQVAARRAEIDKRARDDQKVAAEQLRLQQEAEQAQREAALDAIALEISVSNDDVEVVRQGNRLAIVQPPVEPIDLAGLRRAEIKKLLKREARKMWTPDQNWVVIAPTVAALCLLPFAWYFSGVLAIVAGIARYNFEKRYEAELRLRHPSLFAVE